MRAIRISSQVQPMHCDWDTMRQAWLDCEALGVDCVFNWDHFVPYLGDPSGRHFEALSTLAAMAEVTERVQLGTLVTCAAYRNPDLLADAIRTIDHASSGRAILGLGAGWFARDFEEYGYPFGTVDERLTTLQGALERIQARFQRLNPPPARGHIPILIGGSGAKRTLRLVAQHADSWHAFGNVADYREKSALLAEHCASIGRDPAQIEHSWGLRAGEEHDLDGFLGAGVTHFVLTLPCNGAGYDLAPLRELLEWRDRAARSRVA